MFTDWKGLLEDFTDTIAFLENPEFLIMRALVGPDPHPYAQVARESDCSFYCEVVSTHHLPAELWPIDELALVAGGWEPPMGRVTNWSCTAGTADEAARQLIGALRFGRLCNDPDSFVGTIDRWPPPPDDGDLKPIPSPGPVGLAA